MNKALVIGANGLIGQEVFSLLQKDPQLAPTGTYNKRSVSHLKRLNFLNYRELKDCVESLRPSVIFHCANLSGGVNRCENEPDLAFQFHVKTTQDLVRLANQYKSKLVFISTDYVFPDITDRKVNEDTPTAPLNIYGELKLRAEQYIESECHDYLIFRTTNVYGWDPKTVTPNFMMGLYQSLAANKPFKAPSFLSGNPTFARDLAKAMVLSHKKKLRGLFHAVGPEYIDRYTWCKRAATCWNFSESLIEEIKTAPDHMAPRPCKLSLSTDKLRSYMNFDFKNVGQGLSQIKVEMGR